ncbi:MAG TPA: hypothetical protein VFY40_12280, partial [Blastocatellia bacterium]|nr:hypothetical protein [Blastocatellia bacterium]
MEINKIKKAAEIAKSKTNDKRWINAIDKAVAGVEAGWIVTHETHGIMVTTDSGETYRANGVCQCKAFSKGQPCKHRALARLVEIADELKEEAAPAVSFETEVAATPRIHLIAEIENIWPRVETTPLYTALLARFGVSSLNFLDDDMLRR